jgi:hypothetical protein
MRTDIHKPSLLDPSEYDFIAAFYQGDSPWMMKSYRADMEIYFEAVNYGEVFDGNYLAKNTCDHCGAAFNHGVLFLHIPTDELVHIGHICAANTVGLPDKAAKAKRDAEKYAAEQREREKLQLAGAEWREQNSSLVTDLANLPEDASYFLKDMQRSIEKWGKLTPNQERAAIKSLANFKEHKATLAKREAALVNTPPLQGGRQALQGEILSTKWQDSDYGTSLKMLVQLSDGNRVYGTLPAAIHSNEGEYAGLKIAFTATVKPSDKDPHFGYFSRPAQARNV